MSARKHLAIVVDDLTLGSPGQQILDRFLIGYMRDGTFEERPFETVTVFGPESVDKMLDERRKNLAFKRGRTRAEAVGSADAVVFISESGLNEAIENVRIGTPVFVYGLIAKTEKEAKSIVRKAKRRGVPICAGTEMATLLHLPAMEIPAMKHIGAQIREALIVTNDARPEAELGAFDAVASILEQHGGVGEIKNVRTLSGAEVWQAGDKEWSWRLLGAALSRTDNAQGNTLLDGRTEELVRSGLAKTMAKNPRARVITQSGGLRITIMVLDGVVSDLLVAVRAGRRLMPGSIYSTQLFRSPKPQQEEFSKLVARMIDFFQTGEPPWEVGRAIAMAELNEMIGSRNRDASRF
jgi:hypothetical protein